MPNNIINLIILSLLGGGFLFYTIYISKNLVLEYLHVNKNKSYLDLLGYFCDVSYDMIYKDQILAFSASAQKVTGEQYDTVKRNFVKLTIDLMGSQNLEYLIQFYGGLDSLTDNLLMWFQAKSDNDEVFEYAMKTQEQKQTSELDIILEEKLGGKK